MTHSPLSGVDAKNVWNFALKNAYAIVASNDQIRLQLQNLNIRYECLDWLKLNLDSVKHTISENNLENYNIIKTLKQLEKNWAFVMRSSIISW